MATSIFKQVPRNIRDIIAEIDSGKLGLPELQRGYVWKASKVRDLLDSMMKGYPIGYLMIWDSSHASEKVKQIGLETKSYSAPKSLIIDGQQRMTSLYAVMRHKEIIDTNYKQKYIIISFNPFTKQFEVGDNAKKRAADWIYDISDVFVNETKMYAYVNSFIQRVEEARTKNGLIFTSEEKELVQQSIQELIALGNYSIPTLEIDSDANEEGVADIFVRVNSGGESLGEDDFILTLISVYWQEGRQKIEDFCKSAKIPKSGTAYNTLFDPSPTHIVRIAMGYGFSRARLHYAYLLLRGRDFENEVYSEDLRLLQFETLKNVIHDVQNLESWHGFLKCIEASGYVSKSLISSQNAIVYSYVLYLIGKHDYSLSESELRLIISKWFYMVSVSGYYSSSPESTMESDLADFRSIHSSQEYIELLQRKIDSKFTQDYFNITIPDALTSSAPRNPAWFAYCAALNLLDARVLFSKTNHIRDLFSPYASGTKKALERHHLFPKAYLNRIGISDDRDRNQSANFAYIEWHTNIEILDDSPSEYMKDRPFLTDEEKKFSYEMHALPENWENLDYQEFLNKRKVLMANIIRKGYEKLK